MGNWTPEPWDEPCGVRREGGFSLMEGGLSYKYRELSEPDWERAKACVNALRGIPTEDIEKMAGYPVTDEEIDRFMEENDPEPPRPDLVERVILKLRTKAALKAVEGIPTKALENGVLAELMDAADQVLSPRTLIEERLAKLRIEAALAKTQPEEGTP